MFVLPGRYAIFMGCKTKEGSWAPGAKVFVRDGPYHSDTPCLHCTSHNLLWLVDGLEEPYDSCCACRLREIGKDDDVELDTARSNDNSAIA